MLGRRKEKEKRWDGVDRRGVATVLIVNDDPAACEMLVRLVGTEGLQNDGAPSIREAIGRMADELPRLHRARSRRRRHRHDLKVLDTIRSHDDLG